MPTIFHDFLQQLAQTSWLEWIATLSGLACVYLAAKQNIWNWPISVISVSLYLYIFFQSRIYGYGILQIYFLLAAIYGWYYWRKRDQSDEKPISSLSIRQQAIYFAIILALGAAIGFCLDRWTDSDVPYIDGLCTSMSFIAQFLMTRKYVQSWAIWVAVDVLYIPLYLHKDLAMTAVLYFIFAVIAWNGYRDWRKTFLNTTWQK